MTDPRVERTRLHVLACARTVLEVQGPAGFTFSSVGKVAKVARQTLYRQWQNPEHLLADVMLQEWIRELPVPLQATPAVHLEAFLLHVRDQLSSPTVTGTLAMVMSHAAANTHCAAALSILTRDLMDSLGAGWGPMSEHEYTMMIGPIVFCMMVDRRPVTDEFIALIVRSTMARRSLVSVT